MLRNCCYFIDYGKSTSRFGTLKKIASLEKHCEELRFFKRAGIRVLCSVRCQIKLHVSQNCRIDSRSSKIRAGITRAATHT
jgi:hypothetical protein